MKTINQAHVCKHCRTQMSFSIVTVGTRRSKMKAWLYCEACNFPFEVHWDSDPQPDDESQMKLFPGSTNI